MIKRIGNQQQVFDVIINPILLGERVKDCNNIYRVSKQ